MSEIKRSDTLNIEHYIKHLEANGLTPQGKTPLQSKNDREKNIAGSDIKDIPAICDNYIKLSNDDSSRKNKFNRLG